MYVDVGRVVLAVDDDDGCSDDIDDEDITADNDSSGFANDDAGFADNDDGVSFADIADGDEFTFDEISVLVAGI